VHVDLLDGREALHHARSHLHDLVLLWVVSNTGTCTGHKARAGSARTIVVLPLPGVSEGWLFCSCGGTPGICVLIFVVGAYVWFVLV